MALRASIGHYDSVDSPIHRVDPRVKLVSPSASTELPLRLQRPQPRARRRAVATAVAFSRVPVGRLLAQIKPIALFLVVTSLINLFFVRTGVVVASLVLVAVHADGVEAAVLYTTRFFLLLLAGSLLMLTTTPTSLTDAFARVFAPLERIGVPVSQAARRPRHRPALRPDVSRGRRTTSSPRAPRAAPTSRARAPSRTPGCVPLVVPLFASAIRHADNLGRAMDARCYTGERRSRTPRARVRRSSRCALRTRRPRLSPGSPPSSRLAPPRRWARPRKRKHPGPYRPRAHPYHMLGSP